MERAYVDIHSHLNLEHFAHDLPEVVMRMRAQQVCTIVVGVDAATSQKAVLLAENYPEIYACVGIHPVDDLHAVFDPDWLSVLAAHERVVAIGECGLDYYRTDDPNEKKRQSNIFSAQIEFAATHSLPLMLHGRPTRGTMDAYEDMLAILEDMSRRYSTVRGNAHFFVGSIPIARRFLALNFTLSFPGVITFAREYDEVVQYVPVDMLHAETDAPYATPEPYRGTRNEPVYVTEIVAKIAQIKGHDVETVRAVLRENARRVFGF
jgi:TatD DNase family protein